MEPVLLFYGAWTIEVIRLELGAGSPIVRLFLAQAGTADGDYFNPTAGTRLEADGWQWILGADVTVDPSSAWPDQELMRDFSFDARRGMTATVKARFQSPDVYAQLTLRLSAHAPELGPRAVIPYDFSIPKSPNPGQR